MLIKYWSDGMWCYMNDATPKGDKDYMVLNVWKDCTHQEVCDLVQFALSPTERLSGGAK